MASENTKPEKQVKEDFIINHLPRDLIELIFFKLSVSTLLRCIGVCKQWYYFIRDPRFVTLHLRHAPRCTLLFFPQESVSSYHLPSDAIIFDEAWRQSIWAVPVIGSDDLLCGSSNGLLCLYNETSIKIANLATGECLHLDKPVKNLRGDHFSFYRFGFHPMTKEYKVTHFLGEDGSYSRGTFNVIQVYTLGSEKWKDVSTPEAFSLSCVTNSGVILVDGTMYWLTEETDASWKHAVISFDLSAETFARIQLPAATLGDSDSRWYWTTEIDEKVCIATAEVDHDLPRMLASGLQIWTLDNRVEQRWSQKWNIQHAPNCIPGSHFVQEDKIIMRSCDCNLHLYVLLGMTCEAKLSNMVQLLDFTPRTSEKVQSYTFVKSLVRLDAYKKAVIVHEPDQCEGWQSKKWEAWEHERRMFEDNWNIIHQMKQETPEMLPGLIMKLKELFQHLTTEKIRQHVIMELDKILQNLPVSSHQHPRSLRRLNWVEQKRDRENFMVHTRELEVIVKAVDQAWVDIRTVINYILEHPEGIQISAASTSKEKQ